MEKRSSLKFQNLLTHFPKWIIVGNYILFAVFIALIMLLSTLFNTTEERQISAKIEQVNELPEQIEIKLVSDCIFSDKDLHDIESITIFGKNDSSLNIKLLPVKFLNSSHSLTVYTEKSGRIKNTSYADSLILHTKIKSNRLHLYIKQHFNLFKTF